VLVNWAAQSDSDNDESERGAVATYYTGTDTAMHGAILVARPTYLKPKGTKVQLLRQGAAMAWYKLTC